MKYTAGKVRHIRDDIYQARFTWYEERQGKKVAHQVARNFRAGSNREAEQKRAAIHAQLEREAEIERIMPAKTEPAQTDIADYLYSYARMREGAGAIEKTTLANYRSSTKHILRYIHDVPVSKITAPMVLHMDKMLLADGLVPDTVSAAHRFLKQVLDHAEDVGDIERNPITRAVKPPKRQRREPNGLDDESRRRLMSLVDDMEDTPLTLAIRLGLTAGLRNEEAVGLQWKHLDFSAGVMHIRNCITLAGGQIVEKGPKTAAGWRDIPLDPDLAQRLRMRMADISMIATRPLRDLYVLGSPDGSFYHPTLLSRDFSALVRQYGLMGTQGKKPTFYSLRHTFATVALRSGIDVKTVSSLMGHSSVAETLNTYATTDPAAKAAAGSVIAQVMAER